MDGIAHAAALNLRFCIDAPNLKGITLRLHHLQLRPLAALFERFELLANPRVGTTSGYHVFTDDLTTLYATIPGARPLQQAGEMLSNRPNTEAEFHTALLNQKLRDSLRTGRGAQVRNRVLRMELTDPPTSSLIMEAYPWGSAKRLSRAGKIPSVRSDTSFEILTEQVFVEKALTACNGAVVVQSTPEWLYIRSTGNLTRLTAQIRAYQRDDRRLEAQLTDLLRLI